MAKARVPQRAGKRITIRVSDEVYSAVEAAANLKQWSIAHYVGHVVERAVGVTTPNVKRRAPSK